MPPTQDRLALVAHRPARYAWDRRLKLRRKRYLAQLFFEQREDTMLTGKQFRLERPTLSIDGVSGKRQAVIVPAGATIKVVAGPTSEGDRMVLWDGKLVVDVNIRGTEILDESAGLK